MNVTFFKNLQEGWISDTLVWISGYPVLIRVYP